MILNKELLSIVSASVVVTSLFQFPNVANAEIPTVTHSAGKYQLKSPDWSKINWASLDPIQQPGYLDISPVIATKLGYNPSRTWTAGQSIDSVIMLGDVDDAFKISTFSLKTISVIVPLSPKLTLKDLGLMQWQTPNTLVKAIPSLGSLDINQVPPIYDLFAQSRYSSITPNLISTATPKLIGMGAGEQGSRAEKNCSQGTGLEPPSKRAYSAHKGQGLYRKSFFSSAPLPLCPSAFLSNRSDKNSLKIGLRGNIATILKSNPQAANTPFGKKLDLSRYPINSIPRLNQTQLSKFPGWQQSYINQVPGLNQVPFDKMPQPINSGLDVVGIASVVLGNSERGDSRARENYFVSGKVNRSNKNIPVACEVGKECPYLELGDVAGQTGNLYGKRWASGSTQKVDGGFGILQSVNGGKEPTGRLVYGSGFKVVLTGVNESTGTANFGLFFRFCIRFLWGGKSCSPYFIGPIPWIPTNENDLVILGRS